MSKVTIEHLGNFDWLVTLGESPYRFEFKGVQLNDVMVALATWVYFNEAFSKIPRD